jgi:hypothetical protein
MKMKGIPAGKTPKTQPVKPGDSPAHNSGGNPGKSMPQQPIPGAAREGGPISLQRALAKKPMPSKGL